MATYKDVLMLVDKVTEPLKKISKQTEKAKEKLENMQRSTVKFTDRLKNFGKNISATAGKVASFGKKIIGTFSAIASAISMAGGMALRFADKYAEMGDRIDKMSQKIGMSRKAFQEWDYIMSQNGGNVETLQMGFKTLTTQIEGVQKGSKDSIAAFKALGVSVKDNNGKFRSADDVFNDTVRALQKIENPTQKMILANRLFGRSAAELRPLLNQEADAVDELRKKANKIGLILSDEDINNAKDYKDAMDTFSRFFEAKFAGVMMKIMPDLSKALEEIIQIATENQEVFDNIGQAIKWLATKGLPGTIKAIVWIVNLLKNIGATIGENIGMLMSIPTMIQIAWSDLTTNIHIAFVKLGRGLKTLASGVGDVFMGVINAIRQWIEWIIEKIKWVAKLIPGVSQAISTINNVRQTQNNNNTTNTTNITNNYNRGNPLTQRTLNLGGIPVTY